MIAIIICVSEIVAAVCVSDILLSTNSSCVELNRSCVDLIYSVCQSDPGKHCVCAISIF